MRIEGLWFPSEVAARLAEAASTYQAMPMPKNGKPPPVRAAAWPDTVQQWFDNWIQYNRDAPRLSKVIPSPAQIDRADEAVSWLLWLPPDRRKLLWARACGVRWRKLESRFGKGGRCLQMWHRESLEQIAETLEKKFACSSRNMVHFAIQ